MPAAGSETKASPATSGPSVGSLLQALAKERSKGLVLDLRTGAIVQKATPAKVRTSGDDDPPAEVAPTTSEVSRSTPREASNQPTRPAQPASRTVASEAADVSESSDSSSDGGLVGEVDEEEEPDEISEEAPRSSIPRSETPSSQSLDPEEHFEPPPTDAAAALEKEASAPKSQLRPHRTVTLVPSKAILRESRAAAAAAGGRASNALDSRSSGKDRRGRRDSGAGLETEVRLRSRKDLERAARRRLQPKRQSPPRWRPAHPGDEDGSEDDSDSMESETAPAARPDDSSPSDEPEKPLARARGSKSHDRRQQEGALEEFYRDRPSATIPAVNEELSMPVTRDMQKAEDREAVKAKKRARNKSDAAVEDSIAKKVRLAAESTDVLPKEEKKRLREEKVRDRAAAAAAAAASSAAVSSTTSITTAPPAAAAEETAAEAALDQSPREHKKKKKKKKRKHSAIDEEATPQLADQQAQALASAAATPVGLALASAPQAQPPAAADSSKRKEKKSKKSKRKQEEAAALAATQVEQPPAAPAPCDNFWGPPSASYTPPPAAPAAPTVGAQPVTSTPQILSPFDAAAGASASGPAPLPQQTQLQPGMHAVHKKKRKRHKSKSSSSDSSASSSSGSGASSAGKHRGRRRRRSRSRGGRRRRRKHSKGSVRPPDAWQVWPPPPGAGFTPPPWGWPSAFGWPPGAPPPQPGAPPQAGVPAQPGAPPQAGAPPQGALPQQTGSAWAQAAAPVAATPGPPPAAPPPATAAAAAQAMPDAAAPSPASGAAPESDMPSTGIPAAAAPAAVSEEPRLAVQQPPVTINSEAAAYTSNQGSAEAAAPEVQKLGGEDSAGEQAPDVGSDAPLEGTTGMLASDGYEGAQEDPYGGAEEDPYGGAAEDPYGAGLEAGLSAASELLESEPGSPEPTAAEALLEAQSSNTAIAIDPNVTDPLVIAWQGAAKTAWASPALLELDPELARPTPPHKQRARRKRRKTGTKQKMASEAANPTEPATADLVTDADAESAQAEVLQMPLWSRISEWTALATLELDESLRRLPEKVKSAEYGRRVAVRTEKRAELPEDEGDVPSNPADPPEPDNMMRRESFLLSIGHNPRQGVRMVDWYAPPRLELPQDVYRDPAAYVGTERMRRISARQESSNGGAAPALQLFGQQNPSQSMPGSAQVAPLAPAPAAAPATATKASAPAIPAATASLLSQLAQAAGLAQLQPLAAAALPALPPPPPPPASEAIAPPAKAAFHITGTASKAAASLRPPTLAAGLPVPGWTAPAAVPPLAGDPLANASAAASSHPQAPASYTDKLLAFLTKLETTSTPTDAAVREFWLQLSTEDRTRFSTEFPQFMHYVTGQRQAQAQQAVEPKTLRVDGLLLTVTADELAASFGRYGQVLNVSIKQIRNAQRRVGFVQFARSEDADNACQALDKATFAGAEVHVTDWPGQDAAAELKRRKQDAWAAKLTFHQAVLRIDMHSMQLTDSELAEWCEWVPALLRALVQHSKDPVINADMDFSDNMITDAGVALLTKLLQEHNLHCARVNLDSNRLTDQALCIWGDFIGQFSLPLQELRVERNAVKGSSGILQLARCVKLHQGYPVWRSDVKRYTPFMLSLAGNFIEHSASVTQLITEACGNRPCLAEKQGFWEVQHQCPSIQLPSFTEQQTGPAGAQHWGTGDTADSPWKQRAMRQRHAGRTSASLLQT